MNDQNIYDLKKLFRKKIKELKINHSEEQLKAKSELVFANLNSIPILKNHNNILAYWSLSDEVNTHQWINLNYIHKNIYLPVIDNNDIVIKLYTGENNMIETPPFGIKEPVGKAIFDFSLIDLIIVPGVAFDKQGNRLGRGKGYYDRFLPKTNSIKIGICFDFQLFDNIPCSSSDIKMDYVVSETKIIVINQDYS